MTINEWLEKHREYKNKDMDLGLIGDDLSDAIKATIEHLQIPRFTESLHGKYLETRPRLVCNDGLTVSVQASEFCYCEPRDNHGPYTEVEIGFPSRVIPELLPFAEYPENPLRSVYGYVPVELVDSIIKAYGGIDLTLDNWLDEAIGDANV